MWSEIFKTIEAKSHTVWCELQFEGQAALQPCLESFESFFSSEVFNTWAPVVGYIFGVSYVGYHIWVQGVLTLRHLALFGRPGKLLISIIAIVTISSWLYAMNLMRSWLGFELLPEILLLSVPLIVLYISIIFNANYRILAETSAERRLKMNILLFAQLAIVLIAAALMSTTAEMGAVGIFLIYFSPHLRAEFHKRWSI